MLPDSEKDYLRSFSGIFQNRTEAETYLYDSWERMQIVLQFLRELRDQGVKRVLELGANPYYLTILIQKHFDFELELANFFCDSPEQTEGTHEIESGGKKIQFRYRHFNVETDRFPYSDSSFDCVIFCEILEHLLLSADFPLSEIRRVLRPGGYLILTTPNVARMGNLVRLLKGSNIYADYSQHGIYGRHNREYTGPEVKALLERHSFQITQQEVRNIYPHPFRSRMLQSLRPQTWREHLFFVARRSRRPA